MCSHHWEEIQKLHRHDNLYEFDKDFDLLAKELARKSFEGVLGKVPLDYRKRIPLRRNNTQFAYDTNEGSKCNINKGTSDQLF
jgi:hypothetical protein